MKLLISRRPNIRCQFLLGLGVGIGLAAGSAVAALITQAQRQLKARRQNGASDTLDEMATSAAPSTDGPGLNGMATVA